VKESIVSRDFGDLLGTINNGTLRLDTFYTFQLFCCRNNCRREKSIMYNYLVPSYCTPAYILQRNRSMLAGSLLLCYPQGTRLIKLISPHSTCLTIPVASGCFTSSRLETVGLGSLVCGGQGLRELACTAPLTVPIFGYSLGGNQVFTVQRR